MNIYRQAVAVVHAARNVGIGNGVTGYSSTRPVTDFSANVVAGSAPLAVQFTDASTNAPYEWQWSFGDGATSTSQSPAHTYTVAGTYTVALTSSNYAGPHTETKVNYITVNP